MIEMWKSFIITTVLLAGTLVAAQTTTTKSVEYGEATYQMQLQIQSNLQRLQSNFESYSGQILNKLEILEKECNKGKPDPTRGPTTPGDDQANCEPEQGIRLSGGELANRGRLEVLVRGKWSPVCSKEFHFTEAIVACRQLGYGHATVLPPDSFGTGGRDILVDEVTCTENESNLLDCSHRLLDKSCSTAVGLECAHGACGSRLEFLENVKRDVATRGVQYLCEITREEGKFLNKPCRSLVRDLVAGYNTNKALLDAGGDFGCLVSRGAADDPNRLNACGNNQQSERLDSCDDCQRMFVCIDYPGTKDMRLVDGPDASVGRLEVRWQGVWASVCSNGFGREESVAACRQLGYAFGYSFVIGTFPPGTGPVWLYGIHCTGQEDRLDSCKPPTDGYGECSGRYEVNIKCEEGPCGTSLKYLSGLTSGTEAENGFDRMCYIDRSRPDLVDVKCGDLLRNLSGVYANSTALKAAGGSFGCHLRTSHDTSGLQACEADRQSRARLSDCPSCDRLYVCINFPNHPDAGIRLVGGTVNNHGRVEIYRGGQWGTVCDRYNSDVTASVICRSLGYDYGENVYPHDEYGPGELPVVLTNPRCTGAEERVEDCPLSTSSSCYKYDIVEVICHYH